MLRSILTLLILDIVFIQLVMKREYSKMLGNGQIRPLPGLLAYSFMIIAFRTFVLSETYEKRVRRGAILGACMYGTYSLTNLSISKHWNTKVAVMDILWGTILFSVSALVHTQ